MINYNTSNVIQCLRQYDMFANSLNLVNVKNERIMIVNQLTKLENKIEELTNEIYEKEYFALANKETSLLDEERERLNSLIEIINQRLNYIEKRNNSHYQLTGEVIDAKDVLGANTLDNLEQRLMIIDKYQKNIRLIDILNDEINNLTNKISLVKEKIDINNSLNTELEKKMKSAVTKCIEDLNLTSLLENKNEIEYNFYEIEKCLNMARQNLELAKTSPSNVLSDCQEMLLDTEKDYINYKEQICILKLMEIFNKEVNDYDELLIKRKEMNELLKNIKSKEINNYIYDILTKQYETIINEIEDTNNYNRLLNEKESKQTTLSEIENENNSDKFQNVLGELLEQERKKQEEIEKEKERILEEERQRKLLIERKKQEEILKKQKIIEEARKKEMEKRTKEMLEQQQKSFIQPKKEEEKQKIEVSSPIIQEEINEPLEDNLPRRFKEEPVEEQPEEFPLFKNKVDIEKELFEEFNEEKNETPKEEPIEESNKFPDMSIDEYMNNFNEKSVNDDKLEDLFADDDLFPSIPV